MIREYLPARDADELRVCFVELHETERRFEPGMPAGEAIAAHYLERMFERGCKWDGRVFVAEHEDRVVGFVSVWARVMPEEPDEDPSPYAFVSDLVVLPEHRRRGLGRSLVERAEHFARESGARRIRLNVLADNSDARALYRHLGYGEREIELEKTLG